MAWFCDGRGDWLFAGFELLPQSGDGACMLGCVLRVGESRFSVSGDGYTIGSDAAVLALAYPIELVMLAMT